MIRRLTALTAVGVAGLITAAVGLGGSNTVSATTLRGAVGPGFTISLTKGGKHVGRLKAGTYRLVISDRSAEHNFVLSRGSSVRQLTSIPFVGTRTVTFKLAKGTWTYFWAGAARVGHERPLRSRNRRSAGLHPHATEPGGTITAATARPSLVTTTAAAASAEPGDDRGGHGGHYG